MAQNGTPAPPFAWTKPRLRAAELVAEDGLTDEEIAAEVKVSRSTLNRWKQHPDFEAKVDEFIAALERAARRRAIARRDKRLAGYDERRRRMLDLIEARSKDPDLARLPGGATGLVVGRLKAIKLSYDEREMDEAELDGEAPPKQFVSIEAWESDFDAALLRELRELEKQAAQDAGQWSEKRELTGDGGAVVVVIGERADGPQ